MEENSRFTDPLTLALLGASAGFLDPRGGMQGGFQGAMQGLMAGRDMRRQDMMDKQTQAKLTRDLAARQQLSEIVQQHQGGNPASIANAILATGNPDLMQYAQQFRAGMPKVESTIKGYDESNNPVFHNVMNTGEIISTGIRPAERMSFQNTGQETLGIDPFTGEKRMALQNTMAPGERERLDQSERQFGMSHGLARENAAISRQNNDLQRQRLMLEMDPEYQAQKAAMIGGARESGKLRAQAIEALPDAIGTFAETLNLSDKLKNHPALETMTGTSRFYGKAKAAIGGNKEADFSALFDQAMGKQFLSAIQSMRGFGSLTEREGDKMQSSASAMSMATNAEDFRRAQDDYQQALKAGVRKIAFKAGISEQKAMEMLSGERSRLGGQQSQPQTSSDGWGELR